MAAAQNHAIAQNNLGAMYQNGWQNADGTRQPPNPQEALRFYGLAADQNDALAQMSLGFLYYHGWEGQRPHFTLAVDYLCRAARQQGDLAKIALTNIATFTRPPAGTVALPFSLSDDLRERWLRLTGDMGYIEGLYHPDMNFFGPSPQAKALHDAARKMNLALVCVEDFLHNASKSGFMVTCVEPQNIGRCQADTLGKVILQDTSYFCVGTSLCEEAQTLVDALNSLQNPAVFRNAMGVCDGLLETPDLSLDNQTYFREAKQLFDNAQGICGDHARAVTRFLEANTLHRNKVFMDDVFGPEAR